MAAETWSPPANAAAVPTDVVVEVQFSDYPDPDTIGTGSLLLTTGVFRVPETYRVDLIDKAVLMQPIGNLEPMLGYSASVFPRIHSLAGCPATFALAGVTAGVGPANPPAPPTPTFAEVQAVFDARCAANCHADPDGGCLAAPSAGLSLCAAESHAALVDVPSREVSAILLVEPNDSARSYLLRKVIPTSTAAGPLPTVLGQREPPGAPLTDTELRALAAWIDGGALP